MSIVLLPAAASLTRNVFSTSGLDSSIALSVMQVLRDIAATGRTVIGMCSGIGR